VDGLAFPLDRPMANSCQSRGQCFLSGAALSHPAIVDSGTFPGGGGGGAKPLGLDI
jgi:hypothetical protein